MVSHDNGPCYPVLIRCKRNRLIRPKLCIKLPTDLAKFGINNSPHNPVETKQEQPQTLFITLSVSLSLLLSLLQIKKTSKSWLRHYKDHIFKVSLTTFLHCFLFSCNVYLVLTVLIMRSLWSFGFLIGWNELWVLFFMNCRWYCCSSFSSGARKCESYGL